MSAVEVLEGLKRRVQIALDAAEVSLEKDKRLKALAKRIRLDGFRPGKVPVKVVDNMHGAEIENEIINEKINETFRDAIKDAEFKPAGYPVIVPSEVEGELKFAVEFEVMPEITLNDLAQLEIAKPTAEVTDADLEEMITTLRKQQATWNDEDRAAANGDKIMIDFVGRANGVEFEGGKGTDVPLVLGSNSMIPGFEDELMGVKAGETRTINVTFPENYPAENLKGQAAEFDVTVHKVQSPQLPELNDEFAKTFGIEEGGIAKLREELSKNMVRELNNVLHNQLKTNVMTALSEANPFDIPEALVMAEIQAMAKQSNFPEPKDQEQAEQFMKIAQQAFGAEAEKRARLGLILAELVKAQDLKLDEKYVEARLDNLAATYEDPEEVKAHFKKDDKTMQQVRNIALEDQVIETVLAKAKVVETATTFQEVMNPKKA
ncbi:trigger factor [Wohlfahrtiimonas sp. G9077]|uniref:trigger factor n=1 Tax=Wohlfahrtiimonas sp. G9077 TaxID=1980118 RepID=UPI000B9920ED|nr:trigger factor [Wohlfahrtiimonas sp. G9077]OYQ73779.1 trigger factor [Wohlfahrtiimonas sp. G9077]